MLFGSDGLPGAFAGFRFGLEPEVDKGKGPDVAAAGATVAVRVDCACTEGRKTASRTTSRDSNVTDGPSGGIAKELEVKKKRKLYDLCGVVWEG